MANVGLEFKDSTCAAFKIMGSQQSLTVIAALVTSEKLCTTIQMTANA